MSRRPTGNGHDPRVVPFRPRPKPPKPPVPWKQTLMLFVGLLVGVSILRALLGGAAFDLADLIFAFLFAAVISIGDFVRRRRGIA
jgi:antibiotic biosynthesis monooxygenase (ABM) superfamily enzyme